MARYRSARFSFWLSVVQLRIGDESRKAPEWRGALRLLQPRHVRYGRVSAAPPQRKLIAPVAAGGLGNDPYPV